MKKDPNALMFRQLPEWLQDLLREISREGFIYIGRTGPGLTYSFRRECMKRGTIRAIEEHMAYRELDEKLLVELIAVEGPRWVPYTRILEYCTTEIYQFVRRKG
ncbi:MAG: hypothetical protein JRE40_01725 [Deltaproteobacteria bacterium]|nr:hypothetical protein [Deltaproteobacteria bacterium]MBW2672510.1 hypothetical protein [Deltaproteobacteria bacterium]